MSCIIAYLTFHAFSGHRGLISTIDIDRVIQEKQKYLAKLQNETSMIELKLISLKINHLDLDYLDELARAQLGLALDNETVINFRYQEDSSYNMKP